MIRLKKKATVQPPEILLTKGGYAGTALQNRYDIGEHEFKSADFDNSIYAHTQVKSLLLHVQDNKCCFCESKIAHISHGDVEHFRPKAGWVQNDEKINKPGYYWLAYEWSNLFLCCEICNQRYKKNYFPLADAGTRALNHHYDLNNETPVFINPGGDDAEQLITFKEEIPAGVDDIRGPATISKLGLDRELLNEQRRKTLNMVRDIYELAKGYPRSSPELKKRAKNKIEKYVQASLLDETEYASMLRCFFRNNPIDF